MQTIVKLYSTLPGEIEKFLLEFYGNIDSSISNTLKQWVKQYANPVEIADIIGVYVENINRFQIAMWVSLDSGIFIKVTPDNADELIKYLYERFPY